MKRYPIKYGVMLPEMVKRGARYAVYGIQFRTHKEMAQKIEEVIYFKTHNDFVEWRDLLFKIYEEHEQPTMLYVYHRL